MTRKFWNWVRNEEPDSFGSERTLYLDGEISDETWYGDEVTPKLFKDELNAGDGNITLWINSPGGDVFAAAQIYNMLMDYKGNVTVKIDALAASAASVIAMAGTKVLYESRGHADDPQPGDHRHWRYRRNAEGHRHAVRGQGIYYERL
jgi:ATP-dependent Clp protease protease subunit